MRRTLTEFQHSTEAKLLELFRAHDITPTNRRVEGTSEPFVSLAAVGLQLWLYADGACVIGADVDRVLEKWDFDSLDALQDEFLSIVHEHLPARP